MVLSLCVRIDLVFMLKVIVLMMLSGAWPNYVR